MQYILLIHENETEEPTGDMAEIMGRYKTFGEALTQSGQMLGGERLKPTSTATTVRVRKGEMLLTDGPFAETKEQLGGFYLVEAKDLDEATEMASRIPGAETGCVEVRPVWVME